MMARTVCALVVVSLAGLAGGCCCCPTSCGPGGPCEVGCFCLPKPIVWTGGCNECGPGPCTSCSDGCGDCGILACLRRGLTCGKGCGEIYINEWVSDPPDCCDPCDQCYGQYTGPHGTCCLGPFQRLLAAFHGYSYCPKPCCGPVCGGLCNRGGCGPVCGCGGVGCDSCGGGAPHGAVLSGGPSFDAGYQEGVLPPPAQMRMSPTPAHTHGPTHSILEENWNIPKSQPVPGRPIHKAQQPQSPMGGQRAQMSRPVPRTAANRQAVGTGVQQANYAR